MRSFDDQAMMLEAVVIDGTALQPTLRQLFVDQDCSRVHIHNAGRGCWAATAMRRA